MPTIARDIDPQFGSVNEAKPGFALPTVNQTASKITTTAFVAGTDFTVSAGVAGSRLIIQLPLAPIVYLGRTAHYKTSGTSPVVIAGNLLNAMTREIPFIVKQGDVLPDIDTYSNGEYSIDYETGTIFCKRASNDVTGTATYSYWQPSVTSNSINSTVASSVNSNTSTVNATNAAGGTTVLAARPTRTHADCYNDSLVDVYYGAAAVDATFQKVVSHGTWSWDSQQTMKVFSPTANADIRFVDYYN